MFSHTSNCLLQPSLSLFILIFNKTSEETKPTKGVYRLIMFGVMRQTLIF